MKNKNLLKIVNTFLLSDDVLNNGEKNILSTLAALLDYKGKDEISIRTDKFVKILGISKPTYYKRFKILKDKGYINVKENWGEFGAQLPNKYSINVNILKSKIERNATKLEKIV